MAHRIVSERMVGEGIVGDTERLYRCDNGYGAIVVTESPGSSDPGRLIVTPVYFEGKSDDSYLVVSKRNDLHEGPNEGDVIEPRALDDQEDLDGVIARLEALPPREPTR